MNNFCRYCHLSILLYNIKCFSIDNAINFISCLGSSIHEFYPWVHQLDNIMNSEDQFKKVKFPDCDPSELYALHGTSRFSMTAGDFTEVN